MGPVIGTHHDVSECSVNMKEPRKKGWNWDCLSGVQTMDTDLVTDDLPGSKGNCIKSGSVLMESLMERTLLGAVTLSIKVCIKINLVF